MEKEYVVKLDVYLGVLEARVISFNQLNTGTCKLGFELTSNKQALDLTGKKVTFEVITPSGATLEDAILVTDATQGKAECTLANDMITEQGLHYGEINVYSADHVKMLTFNKFRYLVKEQLGVKNVTVDTRYATLQELIFDVENLKKQTVIDTDDVTQMKNETDLMHKDVIVKHGEVEVKHQEVVTLAQSIKDDASRTDSNAQQVSADKGVVTKAKNEVVAKHDEVLKTAVVIAQDKAIVEQAKTEIVGYKNDVATMKNDVQQLVTDSTEDLVLEGNRQVVRVSTEGTTQVNLAKEEVTKATEQANIAQGYAETAQGELSKVTAEGVKQVKAVATEGAKQIALATEQATIAQTEADKVSGALERLDAKDNEQDNRLTALENSPASNVTLNGEAQTNFNFIGDKGNAIKELHTTDSTGKTSILNFSSSEDFVEMASGRTLREEYMGVLKTMGKEFISTDGSSIQVDNGIEARVISGEIKGQTIKNYCPTMEISNFENYAGNKIENNMVTIYGNGAFSNAWIPYKGGLESNKTYKGVAIIYENTLSGTCNLFGTSMYEVWQGSGFIVQPKQTGILVKTLTTKQDVDSFSQISRGYTTSTSLKGELIRYSIMVLDENSPVPTSYIPFGLNSTQAIISNNGQDYPIYANEEDKANKKVISLPFAEDKVTLNEDGSATWINTSSMIDLSTLTGWKIRNSNNTNSICYTTNIPTMKNGANLLPCDKLKSITSIISTDSEPYTVGGNNNNDYGIGLIGIRVPVEVNTVEVFLEWLKTTKPILYYPVINQTTAHIPKELVPTILTHNQTNILEVGGAVKPSSFKVTLPVDAIGELRAEINEIKKQLGAVAALQLGQIN